MYITRRFGLLFPLLLFTLGCPQEPQDDDDGSPSADCVDEDGDSYGLGSDCVGEQDCDDHDASLNWDDADGDGYPTCPAYAVPGDCDDEEAEIHYGAPERCNGLDDNCDGEIADAETTDADGDGYVGCDDCDDTRADIHPGADEYCGGADEDCDGEFDEDAVDAVNWSIDDDGDGYGDQASAVTACSGPAGTIDDATDCDDTDPEINPRGWDICADGIDQDCTGSDKSCPYAGTVCVSDIEHAHITPNDGDWSIPECMMGVGDIDGDGVGDLTFSDWDNQAREMAYLFYGPIAAAYTIAKPTPWLS